jgi:anti-sigma regulatory factor (Ser/Thr protein kinase)
MKCELSCCLDVQEPKLSDVTRAVTELIGFMRDHGVTDDVFLGEFQLAAAEAINNAVEHGCSPRSEAFFHARLYLRPEYVELRVVDPSDFAGWEGEPTLPDDPFDEGGRGRYLMAQMSDQILHEKENGRHVLVLRKNFSNGPWRYVPGESENTLCSMTEELAASYEMINTLIDLGEWLAVSPEMHQFVDGALERLCRVTTAETAYLRLDGPGGLELFKQWGQTLRPAPLRLPPESEGVEIEVFRTGDEITLPLNSVLPPCDPLEGQLASGFVTPVLFKENRLGVLVLGRNSPSQFFNAGQLKVARVAAEYLGLAVTLRELQEQRGAEARALRDLEIAAEIQLSHAPKF